jgi:hypothetical protein
MKNLVKKGKKAKRSVIKRLLLQKKYRAKDN